MQRLNRQFYHQPALELAPALLGKLLIVATADGVRAGRIIETEAYGGAEDKGSHTYLAPDVRSALYIQQQLEKFTSLMPVEQREGFVRSFSQQPAKVTDRTLPMFFDGGHVYTYLCYGMHTLLNVVAGQPGQGEAVLIRAVEIDGVPLRMTNGPGKVCARLGITMAHNKLDVVTSDSLWIADDGCVPSVMQTAPRVGIAYAQEDALKPWRFMMQQ